MIGPGLHPGMSYEEYDALRGVRATHLKAMRPTALHGHHAINSPDVDKACFRVGDATHVCVLEPHLWEERFVVAPAHLFTLDGSPRKRLSPALKAELAEWQAANGHKTPVSESQDADIKAMAAAVRDPAVSSVAAELAAAPGINECVVIWDDPGTGLRCKARADRIVRWRDWTVVVELKTCRSASPWAFGKAIHDHGYHLAAGFYMDGLDAIKPAKRRHIIIAVESAEPHAVAVYEIVPQALDQGRYDYRQALELYEKCQRENVWPGYHDGVLGIDIPQYGYNIEDDNG